MHNDKSHRSSKILNSKYVVHLRLQIFCFYVYSQQYLEACHYFKMFEITITLRGALVVRIRVTETKRKTEEERLLTSRVESGFRLTDRGYRRWVVQFGRALTPVLFDLLLAYGTFRLSEEQKDIQSDHENHQGRRVAPRMISSRLVNSRLLARQLRNWWMVIVVICRVRSYFTR